jgi:CBS domain-containing protein
MTVAELVRKDVAMLHEGDTIDAAWQMMRKQQLAELPVTDPAGHLVGVLTEHDLLVRLAPRRPVRWWTTVFRDRDDLAADYVRAVGSSVADVMRAAPVAIVPDASIETAASLMSRHALGSLPVVTDQACIGIVTRTDVLDHLAWPVAAVPEPVPDAEIERLMDEAILQELWASRHMVTVKSVQGTIQLTGIVRTPRERSALLAMAHAVPGCAGVENRLVVVAGLRRQPAVI